MKSLFLTCVMTFQLSLFHGQTQPVIGQPEHRLLFSNYPNIIECTMRDVDSTYISCADESVNIEPSVRERELGENACFLVHVPRTTNRITLEVHAIKHNQDYLVSQEIFYVRSLPSPKLMSTSISQSTGANLIIGMGPDCPLTSLQFVIVGGSLNIGNESFEFSGNRIPGIAVEKLKPGKKVVVEITYKIINEPVLKICSGILQVVP